MRLRRGREGVLLEPPVRGDEGRQIPRWIRRAVNLTPDLDANDLRVMSVENALQIGCLVAPDSMLELALLVGELVEPALRKHDRDPVVGAGRPWGWSGLDRLSWRIRERPGAALALDEQAEVNEMFGRTLT